MADKPRLKILHVVVAGAVGGAEQFLVNLATRPEQSGGDHAVALMTPNPKLKALFTGAGLAVRDRGTVRENPLATLWRSLGPADLSWLAQVAQDEKADVLHCHTYGSHLIAARARNRIGIPLVRTEHGTRHYGDPTCGLYRHWALRHTDRIAAVSAYVGRFVTGVAPHAESRIRVIPNGIDLTRFSPVPPKQEGPFTFAAIGRLDPVKRLHIAVTAMAQVPNAHLVLAGEGRERPMLEGLIARLGLGERVHLLGHVADPRGVIAGCDALLNSTKAEGLSLAVLEGAAMGRPAIGFNGGGMPEIVQPGKTGWLVTEDTPQGWAKGLQEAANAQKIAPEMGQAARRWVETRFDINTMCEAYGALYRELVSARHGSSGLPQYG